MNCDDGTVKAAIAILAGGKSSRMGASKAGVELATGKTLFGHVYDCACELDLPCIAVGHVEGVEPENFAGLRIQPDEITNRGPVGALFGLFGSNIARHYLVLACDQPLLTSALLRRLLVEVEERPTVFTNCENTIISPLPGLYPASLLPIVERLLHQPRASLRELLSQSHARRIPLDIVEWEKLRGANTPQDVEEINAILRHVR